MSLDKVFCERESLNVNIVDPIKTTGEAWEISRLRYEGRDIRVKNVVNNSFNFN